MSERSGVLTGKQIEEYKLIENATEECYQACSYDLRLGNEHYVSDEDGKWKLIYLVNDEDTISREEFETRNEEAKKAEPDSVHNLMVYSKPNLESNILEIPAFGSAIIELLEDINTAHPLHAKPPTVIVGRFDLKLSIIYRGLFSQQATQVEPGYRGHLYCFITSQNSQPVKLVLEEPIATIEFSFACVDDINSIIKQASLKANSTKNQALKRYYDEGITDIRWFYKKGRLPQDCGLTPIYQKINNKFDNTISNYLSSQSTIEDISKRVEKNLNTKSSLIKALLSFGAAVIASIGGDYILRVGKK